MVSIINPHIGRIEPLCGAEWLEKHLHDHTHAEIEALGIELRVNGKHRAKVRSGEKKARIIIKNTLKG